MVFTPEQWEGWKPLSSKGTMAWCSSRGEREGENERTNPWLFGAQTVQLSVCWTKANSDGKRCQNEERRLLSHVTTYSIYLGNHDFLLVTVLRAGAYRFERLELIHAHIPQRRVPNVNQIQPLSSNFVLRWQRTHAAALTQHCADLIGQDGVGVVQPASSAQALFEAVEDRLIGQQHHQDPQSCRHCGGVEMFFHEHQEPIKAQRSHQLLTRPAGRKSFVGLLLL